MERLEPQALAFFQGLKRARELLEVGREEASVEPPEESLLSPRPVSPRPFLTRRPSEVGVRRSEADSSPMEPSWKVGTPPPTDASAW